MKPVLHQGKLITWKDDRGFGFIKPNDGGKDVFLHISALKGASRRPKVGDRILYEQVTELDGKIRAARASIQGVAPRPFPTKRKPRKRNLLETVLGVVILAAMALFTIQFSRSRSPSS
ncbi:MAG: cold shock domain-containing protein, partial [Moorea sp. SIO2I5]|nr:cold shock domain-containing protein [Moorena sp. SIO2I5]